MSNIHSAEGAAPDFLTLEANAIAGTDPAAFVYIHNMVVAGIHQTPEYTTAVIRKGFSLRVRALGGIRSSAVVESRQVRQAQLEAAPHVTTIAYFSLSAMSKVVALLPQEAHVQKQFDHLASAADAPRSKIHLVPDSVNLMPLMARLDPKTGTFPDGAWTERMDGDLSYIDDPDALKFYEAQFAYTESRALSSEHSADVFTRAARLAGTGAMRRVHELIYQSNIAR